MIKSSSQRLSGVKMATKYCCVDVDMDERDPEGLNNTVMVILYMYNKYLSRILSMVCLHLMSTGY